MRHPWSGVFPAITTQLREDQSLDLAATARHIEVLLRAGVDGLVILGSLGENQTLRAAEKHAVIRAAVEAVGGRVPVLSGVAETSTESARSFVRRGARLGLAGFMVMPAMVYRADPRETVAHFRAVAAATDRPWMLYNNPLAYPVDLKPEDVATFTDLDNLVAIKESSGDPRRVTDLRRVIGDRLAIFAGVDDLILESALLGIDGWVAGLGIAFPEENQRLWELTLGGRWDEARALYRWFTPLLHLDVHTKFVQYIKLAVQEAGLGAEWVRAPRLPLAGAEREQVLSVIREGLRTRPPLTPRADG